MPNTALNTVAGNAINAGFSDPYWNYAKARGASMPTTLDGGFANINAMYAMNNPVVERQQLMQTLLGIPIPGTASAAGWRGQAGGVLGQLMQVMQQGMNPQAGGAGNAAAFESAYAPARDQLLASLGPGQNDARNQLKNSMIAQGGDGALSSGQYQAAQGQLEERLNASNSGALSSLYSGMYAPWQQAQTAQQSIGAQAAQMPMQMIGSLLSALL